MATFLEIKTRVYRWLRDVSPESNLEVPGLINDALREIQRDFNFKCMEGTEQFSTLLGSNTLGSIEDFKEPREDPYWLDADNSSTPMKWETSLDFLIQRFQEDTVGAPKYVYVGGIDGTGAATLQVYPKSDGTAQFPDGEYQVVIPYWRYLPPLVNDSDTNWFTVYGDKYLRLHAIAWASILNLDPDRAAPYLQGAALEAKKLMDTDGLAQVVRPSAMSYSTGAARRNLGPSWWWKG